jgi:hypothetical protein
LGPSADMALVIVYGNTDCRVFKRGIQNWKDFLPKNQYTQRNFEKFENWVNGEVSKIGHHFREKSDLKIDVIKNNAYPRTSTNILYLIQILRFFFLLVM